MLKFLFAAVLLSSLTLSANGGYQEQPKHCLKQQTEACAVLTLEKTHFPRAGMQVFASQDALFEMSSESIYLIRGDLWVVNEKPVTVVTRFGSVKAEQPGEVWVQAKDDSFLVRAMSNVLNVSPRGALAATALNAGFETRLSFVNRNIRMAEATWPVAVNLIVHLRDFKTAVPNPEIFKQKAAQYAAVVLEALKIQANEDQRSVERQLASVSTSVGLKANKTSSAGRDSYLLKLFRQKNNFAE